jgi:threonine/homoserine/homoserine lactone efflux protein
MVTFVSLDPLFAALPWWFIGAGAVVGLVFQASLAAGVVWTVEVTLRRGFVRGTGVAAGLAFAQVVLAVVPFVVLFSLGRWGQTLDPALRLAAIGTLLWLAWQVRGAPRLEQLSSDLPDYSPRAYLLSSYAMARRMYSRAAAYAALIAVLNIHLRSPGPVGALLAAIGLGLGAFLWWLYFVLLAALFGRRVPEPITVKSLAKLRILAFTVLLGFAVIGTVPLFARF